LAAMNRHHAARELVGSLATPKRFATSDEALKEADRQSIAF